MFLDLKQVASQLGLRYLTEGDVHCSPGWLQFQCPYCQDRKYHLGYNLGQGYFHCWACGGRPLFQTLALLLHLPEQAVREVCKAYLKPDGNRLKTAQVAPGSTISLPPNTVPLEEPHKRYLLSRGFDLGELIKVWNVQGTSWWGPFTWRILIPIYFGGRLISYTLRAIDKEDNPKYWTHRKGSTSTREVLFGWDLLKAKKAVVVEGPFDAMRLGPGAVATLGLGFSKEQVNLLGMLDSLFIIFDAERGAYQRAKKMGRKLAGIVETEIIQLDKGDPADLEQKQADNIMDELGF
jgi:hypothetical protein